MDFPGFSVLSGRILCNMLMSFIFWPRQLKLLELLDCQADVKTKTHLRLQCLP